MEDVSKIAPGMKNASSPLDGVATSGQPEKEQLKRLAEAGYRTVIDLRTAGEDRGFKEPETVRQTDMEYVNIPLSPEPDSFDDGSFDRFRELMADPARRPALVHCGTAVRVGALMIPYLILDEGESREEALEAARRIGPEKEELTRRALQYADSQREG